MARVRLGFVGAGFMGQVAHLRSYARFPECELVALAEGRGELGRRVAARYGIARVYPDHRSMLDNEDLDGVVAAVPFDQHAQLLPELYERCPHVFSEKPLAVGVDTARQLADAASAAGCVHMVGYHKRADPATVWAVDKAKTWQSNGEAGELRYVRVLIPAGDWVGGARAEYLNSDDPPTALRPEQPPVGLGPEEALAYVSFVNYYIHQVNLLRHLLGEEYRVTHVEASGTLLVGESDSGVPAVIEMSPYRTARAWEEQVLVAFEHGYLRVELPAPLARDRAGSVEAYLDRPERPATREIPTLAPLDAMAAQAAWFLRVCRDEVDPLCDADEAARDLVVAHDYIAQRYAESETYTTTFGLEG